MISVELSLTEEEVVDLIADLALLQIYSPQSSKKGRNKLKASLKNSVQETEHEAFKKAVNEYLK